MGGDRERFDDANWRPSPGVEPAPTSPHTEQSEPRRWTICFKCGNELVPEGKGFSHKPYQSCGSGWGPVEVVEAASYERLERAIREALGKRLTKCAGDDELREALNPAPDKSTSEEGERS